MMRNGYDYEIIVSERVDQCEREFAERTHRRNSPTRLPM